MLKSRRALYYTTGEISSANIAFGSPSIQRYYTAQNWLHSCRQHSETVKRVQYGCRYPLYVYFIFCLFLRTTKCKNIQPFCTTILTYIHVRNNVNTPSNNCFVCMHSFQSAIRCTNHRSALLMHQSGDCFSETPGSRCWSEPMEQQPSSATSDPGVGTTMTSVCWVNTPEPKTTKAERLSGW